MRAPLWAFLVVGVVSVIPARPLWADGSLFDAPQKSPPLIDERADDAVAASRDLVQQALECELAGDDQGRRLYLEEALELDPNNALAHWQLGHLQIDRKWLTLEQATADPPKGRRLEQYRNERSRAGNQASDQFALAESCRRAGLLDEARAHLRAALASDPQLAFDASAYELAPYRGEWLTRDELRARERQAAERRRAGYKWRKPIARIRQHLDDNDEQDRQQAEEELANIDDPNAAGVIDELLLSSPDEQTALAGVDALERIEGQDAADALALGSLDSPSDAVRQSAAEALRGRSVYSYAPQMLASLESPIEARFSSIAQPGATTYRLTLRREGPMTDLVFNRSVNLMQANVPGAMPTDDDRPSREREQLARDADRAERRIVAFNVAANQRNNRVRSALRTAADADGTTPRELWQWWYDTNDIYYPPQALVETVNSTVALTETPQSPLIVECFIAGTKVWTATGPVAIETIAIGDRVLSQDVETGELALRPVLSTSVRPATQLLKLSVDGETFVVTRGHPLWVVGHGWRMAHECAVGDRLRTLDGTVTIEAIDQGPKAQAYNFVVAQMNSYFVGEAKLLAHDNSLRRPIALALPGLAQAK